MRPRKLRGRKRLGRGDEQRCKYGAHAGLRSPHEKGLASVSKTVPENEYLGSSLARRQYGTLHQGFAADPREPGARAVFPTIADLVSLCGIDASVCRTEARKRPLRIEVWGFSISSPFKYAFHCPIARMMESVRPRWYPDSHVRCCANPIFDRASRSRRLNFSIGTDTIRIVAHPVPY